MEIRSLRWLLAMTALLACLTACQPTRATSVPSGAAPTTSATGGKALYDRYCAVCHGLDGHTVVGVTAPSLNNQALLSVVDDTFLHQSIALGRPGANTDNHPANKMSIYSQPLGGPLSDDEIAQIVAYVRQWQTAPSAVVEPFTANGDPRAGKEVFAVCVACHMADGWSKIAPSLAGSAFQQIASDAFIRHMVLNGRIDVTTMTAFKLDDKQIGDLIAYIRTLGK
jgi:cytochrome c oxidase cbb3-type subunit III